MSEGHRKKRPRKYRVALIYNAYRDAEPESKSDSGSVWHLRQMVRHMARIIRGLGHTVTVVPIVGDLNSLQRKLRRLRPHVVFNQYDDVVHGALYEMRVAAFIAMLGFPMTGSPALALSLSRFKYMALSLLKGAEIPIPPGTTLVERLSDLNGRKWHYPLIVHPGQEHSGIGLARDSVVHTKTALRQKVREILTTYKQPALVQRFLPGREFNVGILGGRKLRVLPLAEVDYSRLPDGIPPIMSYAAKYIETSVEFKKTEVTCPAEVDPDLGALIAETAVKAFRTVGGWGYGRVDIRLDEDSSPRVLEVNCNPCLDEGIGLARSAEAAGIEYPELLQAVIKAAFEGPPYDMKLPIFNMTPVTRKRSK
jgi:D-alanine-D-alanine ligase